MDPGQKRNKPHTRINQYLLKETGKVNETEADKNDLGEGCDEMDREKCLDNGMNSILSADVWSIHQRSNIRKWRSIREGIPKCIHTKD